MNHARVEPCPSCGLPTIVVVDEEGTPLFVPIPLSQNRANLLNDVLVAAAAYVEAEEEAGTRYNKRAIDAYVVLVEAVKALAESTHQARG